MKLNDENICRLMKILFSTVILQLLYISLVLNGNGGDNLPYELIPKALESCAASASLTVAGGFVLYFADMFIER